MNAPTGPTGWPFRSKACAAWSIACWPRTWPMPDRDPELVDMLRETFWRLYLRDPFAVRGLHQDDVLWSVRAFLPGAERVEIVTDFDSPMPMQAMGDGFFYGIPASVPRYRLRVHWPGGAVEESEDPYAFGPVLGQMDLHLFAEGAHWELAQRLGAVPIAHEGVEGVSFAVWAPNARRVSVVGDFNSWDGRRHPMRLRHEAGIWEIFIPRLKPGAVYKYEIEGPQGVLLLIVDPVARATEHPPATGS